MKKVILELTDDQFQSFEDASKDLASLGIPVEPKALIKTIIMSRQQDEITSDFLNMMKRLVTHGKTALRQRKGTGN